MSDLWLFAFVGITVISYLVLYVQERRHELERKDLLNRIMARDYHEYNYAKPPDGAIRPQKNALRDAVKHASLRDPDGE